MTIFTRGWATDDPFNPPSSLPNPLTISTPSNLSVIISPESMNAQEGIYYVDFTWSRDANQVDFLTASTQVIVSNAAV